VWTGQHNDTKFFFYFAWACCRLQRVNHLQALYSSLRSLFTGYLCVSSSLRERLCVVVIGKIWKQKWPNCSQYNLEPISPTLTDCTLYIWIFCEPATFSATLTLLWQYCNNVVKVLKTTTKAVFKFTPSVASKRGRSWPAKLHKKLRTNLTICLFVCFILFCFLFCLIYLCWSLRPPYKPSSCWRI